MITKNFKIGHRYDGLDTNPTQQMNIGNSLNNQVAGQASTMGLFNPNLYSINVPQLYQPQQTTNTGQAGINAGDTSKGAGLFSKISSGLGSIGGGAWGGAAGAGVALLQNTGVSEEHDDGMMDRLDPMHYLANGRHSTGGDVTEKIGTGLFATGASTLNPILMAAGAATKIVGDVVNAGWGHKTDDKALAAANQGTSYLNNFSSSAQSFDDLQGVYNFGDVQDVYEGGWFNKKKWRKKNRELQEQRAVAEANAQNQFNNNLMNLQQDQRQNALANYAAFGGTLSTQGSDWSNGLTFVDNGGSHESNPLGGVPMGIAQDGQPNLVEEGETIYNGYVFSKRIKVPKDIRDRYKLKEDISFADAIRKLQKGVEERPNDPIAKRGFEDTINIFTQSQEQERQKIAERKARRQAKQAAYAYGGHLFAAGSVLNGPPPRILFKGKYPLTLASDGLHYEGDVMGNRYKVTAKDAFANPDDYSTLLDEVDAVAQRNQIPSFTDAERAEMNRLEAAESIRTGAVNLNSVNEEDFFYKYNPQFIDPVRGRIPMDYITNIRGTYAIDPRLYNSDWWNDGYKAQAATQTVQPTSTSKSTSTGKGTGTKTSSPMDYSYLSKWLENPDNFAAANAAAQSWGSKSFNDAKSLYNTAITGKPGAVMNGLMGAYRKSQSTEGINRNPYEEGDDRIASLWNLPTNDTIPTLSEFTNGNYFSQEQLENSKRYAEYKGRYGNKAEKMLAKHGFNADGSKSTSVNGTTNNPNNPNTRWAGWRYAPVVGSALAVLTDPWLNRPDYKNADLVLEAGNSAKDVSFNPIGDYLPYKPFDRLFYANQLAAQQGATRRSLLNTTGGNASTARGLLLAADNQGINQMGNLWRQAEEYNAAQRQAVADFNRGTNMFNSEGQLKADMANQGQGNVKINAAIEAAKLRELEDNRVATTRSANFTNLFDNLGDIGRENFAWNQVNQNPALYYQNMKHGALGYKGYPDGDDWDNFQAMMDRYNAEQAAKAAFGGYITIKDKKRR